MAPTVQLLPPNAPQWIQLQWNHWYTVLNRPETDPAMQQRIIQQLNTLVAQARQLQQAAQQTAQQSTVLSQIAAQLRTMLQSVQPYLRQALAFAGAPVAVAMRYVSLASAFLVSDGAAVMLMGFALAAAKVMLAVLAVIALLILLSLLYQALNDAANAIQRSNQRRFRTGPYGMTPEKEEAARRVAVRERELMQVSLRKMLHAPDGLMVALDRAYRMQPA